MRAGWGDRLGEAVPALVLHACRLTWSMMYIFILFVIHSAHAFFFCGENFPCKYRNDDKFTPTFASSCLLHAGGGGTCFSPLVGVGVVSFPVGDLSRDFFLRFLPRRNDAASKSRNCCASSNKFFVRSSASDLVDFFFFSWSLVLDGEGEVFFYCLY